MELGPGAGRGRRGRRSREAGGGRREAPGPFKRPPSRPQPPGLAPAPSPRRGPLRPCRVERLRRARRRPREQPQPMRAARPAAGADETELPGREEERRLNAAPESIPAVRASARRSRSPCSSPRPAGSRLPRPLPRPIPFLRAALRGAGGRPRPALPDPAPAFPSWLSPAPAPRSPDPEPQPGGPRAGAEDPSPSLAPPPSPRTQALASIRLPRGWVGVSRRPLLRPARRSVVKRGRDGLGLLGCFSRECRSNRETEARTSRPNLA